MASAPHKKFTFECDDITPALNQASTDKRNLVWKKWYDSLICQLATSEYRFINYGYLSSEDVPVDPTEEYVRNFIGLYQRTLGNADLAGKDVLDVSSGLGGDTDCIQDVIDEFSDWRSYHRCRVSLGG
jgi:hypothetical protein